MSMNFNWNFAQPVNGQPAYDAAQQALQNKRNAMFTENMGDRRVGNANDMMQWMQQGNDAQAFQQQQQQQAEAQRAEQARQKMARIKELTNEIYSLEQSIKERESQLGSFEGNRAEIAALEARKINKQDPTAVWRWKTDKEEARRITEGEKNKQKQLNKINIANKVTNQLAAINPNDATSTAQKQVWLNTLANLKTEAQSAENQDLVDAVDAKIKELNQGKEQTQREEDTTDFETLLNNPNLSPELIDEFEATNPNLSRKDWGRLDNKRAELTNKVNKKKEADRKTLERVEKILKLNPNSANSDEIAFMEKQGYKRVTGDKLSDTKWVKVK